MLSTGHRLPEPAAGLPACRPGRMFSGTGRVLGELVVSLPMRHTRRLELYRHRDRLQGRSAAVPVSGRQLPARVEPPGIWWGERGYNGFSGVARSAVFAAEDAGRLPRYRATASDG